MGATRAGPYNSEHAFRVGGKDVRGEIAIMDCRAADLAGQQL